MKKKRSKIVFQVKFGVGHSIHFLKKKKKERGILKLTSFGTGQQKMPTSDN